MTTQNHSYEVSDVPDSLEVTQWNVNDESPEGLAREGGEFVFDEANGIYKETPILCRQYHPEANPGPEDSFDFFDDVIELAES